MLYPLGDSCYARVDVVGRGGALLRSPRRFSPGEELGLEVCVAAAVIRTLARVLSCRRQGSAYAVGVEFVGLGEEEASLLEQSMLAEPRPVRPQTSAPAAGDEQDLPSGV